MGIKLNMNAACPLSDSVMGMKAPIGKIVTIKMTSALE